MIYFLLPRTHKETYKHIQYNMCKEPQKPFISESLCYYLLNIKNKINIYEKEWNLYKKYTNPYEFIHTTIPFKKKCIAKHKPLSRSFFKMVELIHLFYLNKYENASIQSFHLAEGPGGFIEAFSKERNNPKDKHIGMTLLDDENNLNIPSWKKSNVFLNNHPNIHIENGCDNTGNILSIENFTHVVEKYGSSMDFITADGGFDFSNDFDNQEINIGNLLYGQVVYALCLQKKHGNFVLKIFDAFFEHTAHILYILSSFYENVYITKPNTSRSANSEKYIICKGFLFSNSQDFYPFLHSSFEQMMLNKQQQYTLLKTPIPMHFTLKLEECNSIFGQQQIENIHSTISFIIADKQQQQHPLEQTLCVKFENNVKNNVLKCTQWCVVHKIQYNKYLF